MTSESNEHAKAVFTRWLTELPTTSPLPHVAQAADMRRNLFKFMLKMYGVGKAADLPDQAANTIAKALGLPIPGPIEVMKIDGVEYEAKPYTPGPRRTVAERPHMDSLPSIGVSRIDQMRADLKNKATARYKLEREADLRGEYFTVVASYNADKVFLVIFQGIMDDEWHEAFLSQHTDAFMFLDRTGMIGSFGAVRSGAVRIHTGKHPGDVTVRVILKKGTT